MIKGLHNQVPEPDFDGYLRSSAPAIRVPEDLDRRLDGILENEVRPRRGRPTRLFASCVAAMALMAVIGFEVIVGAGNFEMRDYLENARTGKVLKTLIGDDWLMVPPGRVDEDPENLIPRMKQAYEQFMSGEGRIVDIQGWTAAGFTFFFIGTEVDFGDGPEVYWEGEDYPTDDDLDNGMTSVEFGYALPEAGTMRDRIENGEATFVGIDTLMIREYEVIFRKYSSSFDGWGEVIFFDAQMDP